MAFQKQIKAKPRVIPEPGPEEVLIVRGRTQTESYHDCSRCCKLRDQARAIRRSIALYRGLTKCEFCLAKRCCLEHREPQKTLDRFVPVLVEAVA